MKKRILAQIGLLSVALSSAAFAGDRYLIRVPSGDIDKLAAKHGLTVERVLKGSAKGLFAVRLDSARKLAALKSDPSVTHMEEDGAFLLPEVASKLSPRSTSNLGLGHPKAVSFHGATVLGSYTDQPAASTIWLNGAHQLSTGAGAVVAVIDTGVDPKHPVLKDSLAGGWDFTRNTAGGSEMADLDQSTSTILDAMQSTSTILDGRQSTSTILDMSRVLVVNQSTSVILDQSTSTILDNADLPAAFGHGTMVAGLVHLVAPAAKIMPVKVFDGNGVTTVDLIVQGIYYAVDNGATVINMSFSSKGGSDELKAAIDYAMSKGVICVASAGNDGEKITVYPAGYGVVAVGSTNAQMVRSSFSNYGRTVSLAAPGEGVITLFPASAYAAAWGTSFSAPMVAGAAALLGQIHETDHEDAERALSSAWLLPGQQLGAGELNASWACIYRMTHDK